jgi:hypothetical protein
MPELYPSLSGFRVVKGSEANTETLREMGVPEELLGSLTQGTLKYQERLDRLELRIFYALIPRLKAWIDERNKNDGSSNYARNCSQAYSFVQRLDVLEKRFKVKRPKAPALQKKIDAWNTWRFPPRRSR